MVTEPSPVVLGELRGPVLIRLSGIEGWVPAKAAANVGEVTSVSVAPRREVHVWWSAPEENFPQTLCLILWRAGPTPGVEVVRVPLHGQTRIPIRTRARSEVRVVVGGRRYGPLETGWRGRIKVPVVVPPGVGTAKVEVTDRVGMRTHKTIRIDKPVYMTLALAAIPTAQRRYRLEVAAADPAASAPQLEVDGKPLALERRAAGLWTADYSVPPRRKETVSVRAWLSGLPALVQKTELQPDPEPAAPPVEVAPSKPQEPSIEEPRREPRLRAVVGVTVGMLHNTGDLLSPRVGAEAGIELRLPRGWIGLRGMVGASWASQDVAGSTGLSDAESRVLLLPVGVALSYRLPWRVLTPYALVGLLGQLVRTSASAGFLDEDQLDSEWVLAVLGMAGAERGLGPGLVFLQLGFQWARVESPAVELLAGGVVLEAGYRYRF